MCNCKLIRRIQRLLDAKTTSGLQAETIGSPQKLMATMEAIVFNQVVSDLGNPVSLNTTTGEFTANRAGNFLINYYVNIDGTETIDVAFSIKGIKSMATYAVQGQMTGFTLIHLNTGETFSVINSSGAQVRLANCEIQAGIVVTTV